MATTLDAPDTTQISRMSAQLSSLKEVIRPKDLHPSRFIPLMEQWLDRRQPLTREECIKRGISCLPGGGRTPEYVKVESELMHQMPIKGEQLSKIPTLLPDLTAQCKPPTMCFGWIIGADEIEQLGRAKGQYMELTPVDYYEPEDPDRPPDVDAVFEDGVYEVRGEPYFSPEWTADGLLLKAKKELRLNDKYVGRCPYFTRDSVTSGFDQRDTVFVSIYTNLDLLPQQQAKAPLPTRDDIKWMQEWLGLKGEHREPGWWFSVAGLARTSWRQYWIEGDM